VSAQPWELFRAELAKGQWRTARDAQHWLKKELGLEIADKEVYRHLGKLRARLKVGCRSHLKKDPDAEAACRNGGLEEKLDALSIPAGRLWRVWVTDAARFGLHTGHRRSVEPARGAGGGSPPANWAFFDFADTALDY